jgi:hypothetical protein
MNKLFYSIMIKSETKERFPEIKNRIVHKTKVFSKIEYQQSQYESKQQVL